MVNDKPVTDHTETREATELPVTVSHTRGPWSADGYHIRAVDGIARVATVAHDQQGLRRGHELSIANARLIAAAPDLLIACRFVYACLQQERAWRNPDLNQAMIILSDVIAKAEGR